jgi:hypothetical protein
MMHLKQIEREALALRAAGMESSGILNPALECVVKLVKRLSISLRTVDAGDSANVGGRYSPDRPELLNGLRKAGLPD